jgi:hypothetical protein
LLFPHWKSENNLRSNCGISSSISIQYFDMPQFPLKLKLHRYYIRSRNC